MTNNERDALIEKAAEALAKAEGIRSWSVMSRTDQKRYGEYAAAVLAVFEQASTPTDDERTPEFEALEQELFKHQPVLSMSDGHIAGCQCMDRVFQERTEDWGTHLAEVFTALRRPVQGDHHDEGTLRKVYDALTAEGYGTTEVTDMVNAMQNVGILFRERRPVQGEPTSEAWRASIVDERTRQFTKGYGVDHDREHGVDHLLVWAQDYARRGEPLKSAALIEAARELLARLPDPSRAKLSAAIEAYKESARMHPGRTHMRAALRAAAAVTEQGGENR